ncbi:MAG TPA: hypothetical protein VHY20_09485 [Pirellulales bacterium]|jgi:hypothetical protein|nr:hypothetical protein [Pirellulales bacterium]
MSNVMRWRYGDTNPVVLSVDGSTLIEIGDLVYLNSDNAWPAANQSNQGTETANQQLFHSKFAGVAMQCSPVGSTDPIRVATTGVFEYDCTSATFEVGALLGPDQPGGGTVLASQQVVAVAAVDLAIGRCASRVNPAGISVLVDVVSTVLFGGPEAAPA